MKFINIGKNKQMIEVPETWQEAEDMAIAALGAYYDERGRNVLRLSIAARIAYGMFGKQTMAPDPTTALLYLLQRVCQREGAGLDK
jgi:hypothetical protein